MQGSAARESAVRPRSGVARGGRPPKDVYQRRRDLYVLAAPVFERLGYRRVTLKALARACGLSIPALYRYFPSKRAFALFPLAAAQPELHRRPEFPPGGDPLVPLRHFIDAAVAALPHYTLALRLLREMEPDEAALATRDQTFRPVLDALAAAAQEAAPRLDPSAAQDFSRTALALVIAPALPAAAELRTQPGDLRRQLVALARSYLVPAGLDGARFDAAIAARP